VSSAAARVESVVSRGIEALRDWWIATEQGLPGPDPGEIEEALRLAHDDELRGRIEECSARLARLDVQRLPAIWRNVHELLECRLVVRRARVEEIARISMRLERLLETLPAGEAPTRARVLHTAGVACIRLDRLQAAEERLTQAAQRIGDAPALAWIAESFAQVLMGQGAWEEVRLILSRVLELKRRAGDSLGVAISTGSLARLHAVLREDAQALEVLGGLWRDESLEPITRLRLATLALEAQTRCGTALDEIVATARHVQHLSSLAPGHPLAGYADLALAQALHQRGEPFVAALGLSGGPRDASAQRLAAAGARLNAPDQRAWLAYHEVLLLTAEVPGDAWLAGMRELFDRSPRTTESEVRTHLLIAERAHTAGMRTRAREHLEVAETRATASNNPHWVALVEDLGRRIDPEGHAERVAHRLSGRSLGEMTRTERREATIIFSDLVDFTPRSHQLRAEEVMSTVRSVFQLTSQSMGTHRIRPLSYLGDGLLAIAEGAEHAQRGVRFALEIVARAGRVTRVHRALGIPWGLELRAGVASGPVVVGAIGTQFKQEFAAIGLTTNLAARLQGQAMPGQVMIAEATARASGMGGAREELRLKGFADVVHAVRVVPDDGLVSPDPGGVRSEPPES
jgi:class 3 adenylate cyclase